MAFSHFPDRRFLARPALQPSEHGICHISPQGWHWLEEHETRVPLMVGGHFPEQHEPHTHAAHGLHDPPSHSFEGARHLDPGQHCCHVPPHSWLPACSRTLCDTTPSGYAKILGSVMLPADAAAETKSAYTADLSSPIFCPEGTG